MHTTSKLIAVALVSLSLLASCASTPQTEDGTRTRQEATAAGAVVGGLLGALIGGDEDRVLGAAVGAAVGGAAGYAVGNEVAKRKAKYANEERFLDAEIANAAEYNRRVAAYNADMSDQLAALERRSHLLKASYQAGRVRKSELTDERKRVTQRLERTQEIRDSLEKEHKVKVAIYEQQKEKREPNNAYVRDLEREIVQMEQNISELEQGSTQLAQIEDRLLL